MPTYQYACTECGERLEAVQSFSDPALTDCPVCQGRLRKVFNSVGVVFKGSGFYRNDSRKPEPAPSTTAETKTSETKSDSKSESKSDSKSESRSGSKSDSSPAKTESKPSTTPASTASSSSSSS